MATSYKNLVNFGPVSPEILLVICVHVSKIRQKLAYPAKYFRTYSTDLHQIFSFGTYPMGEDDKSDIYLRLPKERCYGSQLILWANIYTWVIPPALYVLAFHNELEYRNANARVNSVDDAFISDRNLVNSRLVAPGLKAQLCTAGVNQHWG